MRELIYLSTAKLRQFRPDRSAGRWRRVREIDAKAPFNAGGLRFSFPDDAAPSGSELDRVLRHLLVDSDRPPRWYTEEGLEPGQWVQFEARMNFEVLESAPASGSSVLVFWEVADHADGDAGPARLLLHGSPRHLLSAGGADEQVPYHTVSTAPEFLRSLATMVVDATTNRSPSLESLDRLMAGLDGSPPELASWVAGLARLTAVVPHGRRSSIVVASPLYVEYGRTAREA